MAAAALTESGLSDLTYDSRSAVTTIRNSAPMNAASSSDCVSTCCACSRSLRPAACEMRVVVPTASICVIASTMNVRLPAMPTPAIASFPRRPTQYRSTRK